MEKHGVEFFNIETGEIISEQIKANWPNPLGHIRVGIISANSPRIVNGKVINSTEFKEFTHDPFAYAKRKNFEVDIPVSDLTPHQKEEIFDRETTDPLMEILHKRRNSTQHDEMAIATMVNKAANVQVNNELSHKPSTNDQILKAKQKSRPKQKQSQPSLSRRFKKFQRQFLENHKDTIIQFAEALENLLSSFSKATFSEHEKRVMIQKALAKSKTAQKQSQLHNDKKSKKFDVNIIAIILATVIGITSTIGIYELIDFVDTQQDLGDVRTATAWLLSPDSKYTPASILGRNTHFTNYAHDTYWYDNFKIAQDILALPDEAFDAILYQVYDAMGENRENGPYKNWDDVISYLGNLADPDTNKVAYKKTNGCYNFEAYLIKYGFVDKNGNPSVDAFIDYSKEALDVYAPYLDNLAEKTVKGAR